MKEIWCDDSNFKCKDIIIEDWAGNILYKGSYLSNEVDKILEANRCKDCVNSSVCKNCNCTGYSGDFEVHWVDQSDKKDCNVYEFINY